jgi:hypothetical protein
LIFRSILRELRVREDLRVLAICVLDAAGTREDESLLERRDERFVANAAVGQLRARRRRNLRSRDVRRRR